MNERIKELMEQSMPVIDWQARHGVELNNGERLQHMSDWFEKFAELIVKDCRDMFVVSSVSWNLLNEKLEHFGVEE